MKVSTLFRGVRIKRDKNPLPAIPFAAKELAEEELKQVQGGRKAGENPREYPP